MEKCSVCEKHVDEVERIVLHTDFNVCSDCNKLINERYFVGALKELRRTKRALWIARAERAEIQWAHLEEIFPISMREEIVKWQWAERKCRAKAEEYK